jgi:hypothetical protein
MDTNTKRKTTTAFTDLKTLETPTCLDSQAIQTAGPFHNVATYVGHGIFCRDIVSVTYVVAVGFCIAGATQTMREAQYLGAGTLINEDGVFDAGLQAYQYFLVAAILACASNGFAIGLSLMSRVNSTMTLWWPEHNLADLLIRLVHAGLDVGWIVLCVQAITMYTPEPSSWCGITFDCTATGYKYPCAICNALRFKNMYAKLLDRADLKKDSSLEFNGMYEYGGPYFHDLVTNFTLVFGLRFALTFLISAWANYKPLYLLGVSRTVCDPLGCGDKGGRATSEHVECGWTLGGLWSKWSNNQLGALRNHDWVGATFFFVAYLVLSTGLNNNDINGSFIPRRSVLEEYATTLKNEDVKNRFMSSYKTDDGTYQPCAVKFPLFTYSSANSNIWDRSEMTLFGDFMDILAQFTKSFENIMSERPEPFSSTTNLFKFILATSLIFQQPPYYTILNLNQQSCANLETRITPSIWLGLGFTGVNNTYYSLDAAVPSIEFDGKNMLPQSRNTGVEQVPFYNVTSNLTGELITLPPDLGFLEACSSGSCPTFNTTDGTSSVTLSPNYIEGYQSGQYFISQQCCRVTKDAPVAFEGSLSQRFELYSILLFVGSLFATISALAQLVALSFYNVRARPLSLVEPDGGYTMTVA